MQTSDMLDYKHSTHSQYGYRSPSFVHSTHKIIKDLWDRWYKWHQITL